MRPYRNSGPALAKIKIPYYVVRERHGKRLGVWQPTKAMRDAGFTFIACGEDGPAAWAIAERANAAWKAHKQGSTKKLAVWPPKSVGDAFERYRATQIWARKADATKQDWMRGWRYIEPDLGKLRVADVTLELIDVWYAVTLESAGVREAHRAMKIWRALYNVAASMQYCVPERDPSMGVRRLTPKGRTATWDAAEVVAMIHKAWRGGFHGLAIAISIAWDTGFSPVDVRTATWGEYDRAAGRWGSLIRERTKTGAAGIGTLSRRSAALIAGYLRTTGITPLPSTPIIRTRRGKPYSKNDLAKDFRWHIRAPGDDRKIADIRRSVGVEARAGGATLEQVAGKLANRVDANAELERTYLPAHLGTVQVADAARLRARKKNKPA